MIGSRTLAIAALLCALLLAGQAASAPEDDLLPKGPAKAIILRACTNCHGTYEIVHAWPKTTDQWRDAVVRMQMHGAEVNAEQVATVATYLGKYFAPVPQAPPPAAATPAPASPPSPLTPPTAETPA